MNIRLLLRILGSISLVEAAAMLPALLIALGYGDGDVLAFLWPMLLLNLIGIPLRFFLKPEQTNLFQQGQKRFLPEGFFSGLVYITTPIHQVS